MTAHFYPGMGADSRIWNHYRTGFVDAVFHDWMPMNKPDVDLADYVKCLIKSHGISPNDTIIGVSMGGIVAAEIGNQVPNCKIIQVSSCTNIDQLNSVLKFVSPLGNIISFGKLACVPDLVLPSDAVKLANQMYKDSDHKFIKWSCSALMNWKGMIGESNVIKIMGTKDFVFPIQKQRPQYKIDGGSHLMVMTHHNEICSILQKCV